MVVQRRAHAFWVVSFVRNSRSRWTEMGGQIEPKCVVRFERNAWSACAETAGQIRPEYADVADRIDEVAEEVTGLRGHVAVADLGPEQAVEAARHERELEIA